MGADGLEPSKTEVGRFTVSCNCRYAMLPKGSAKKDQFKRLGKPIFRYTIACILFFRSILDKCVRQAYRIEK